MQSINSLLDWMSGVDLTERGSDLCQKPMKCSIRFNNKEEPVCGVRREMHNHVTDHVFLFVPRSNVFSDYGPNGTCPACRSVLDGDTENGLISCNNSHYFVLLDNGNLRLVYKNYNTSSN